MSHPEKYTEAFMATKVVKPLLDVLVYLHGINVVHQVGPAGRRVEQHQPGGRVFAVLVLNSYTR